jgi:hypothetical protein
MFDHAFDYLMAQHSAVSALSIAFPALPDAHNVAGAMG